MFTFRLPWLDVHVFVCIHVNNSALLIAIEVYQSGEGDWAHAGESVEAARYRP